MPSITFVVPGEPAPKGTRGGGATAEPPVTRKGTVKHSVRVAARRGEGGDVRVTATPGQDVVVLHIDNGPSLILHPEHARDLILAQKNASGTNRGARASAAVDADEIQVPTQLQWRVVEQTTAARGGATRSRLGDVFLKGVEVITDAAKEFATDFLVGQAQSLTASLLVSRVDAQVEEAMYRLNRKTLPALKASGDRVNLIDASDTAPALVLVHGTFSNTSGTFSKLWTQHPDFVERLFQNYGDRVFALDHRTLGASPISNALTLVTALPNNARLHIVTHSRGGLVGEVLAHACGPDAGRLDVFDGQEYRQHRDELSELIAQAKERHVQVERLVRVACPARGTLLASKRLDAYLSIFKWSLELGGVPVLPEIVDFLNGVAQYRADPTKIPGLAAQIPDNPLVRWIHDVNQPIGGDLRVVAGDLAGDSIMSWLKTLLADAFYWTDNDLVVQTRSMYGGTPRATTSTFVLDRGGKVSHFAYFANAQTAGAIVNALVEPSPQGFQTIGPLSYGGKDSSGTRAAREGREAETTSRPDLPAVIIVPGIFGTHLRDDQGRVWLNWKAPNPLRRLAINAAGVTVDGLVEDFYSDLSRFLSPTHEVLEFAYDWRQPIQESAKQLRSVLAEALKNREATGTPVRILAHSSGGIVVRALQLLDNDVWTRWLQHADARLLMLGPPNAGFWMPMQVLSGDDSLGGMLAFGSVPFREQETRQMFAEFPGFIELQAGLLNDALQLARESRWRELAYDDVRQVTESTTWHTDGLQRRTIEWGVPLQARLNDAVALRKQLDDQLNGSLSAVGDKIVIVVGAGSPTPSSYEVGTDGLQYVYTQPGDAYVTHQSASLPGAAMWALDGSHTMLANARNAFGAYLDLLRQGRTNQLSAPTVRGARHDEDTAGVRMRPARMPKSAAPPLTNEALLGAQNEKEDETSAEAQTLRLTVVNGDLSFVRQPLLLGHYRSSELTGAEWVVNELIGGTMRVALRKGQYPDSPESHQVFVNTRVPPNDPTRQPRPESVIVVGLGEEGKLQSEHLIRTVKRGVIAWAQRVSERSDTPATFDLAATLIGSGGIGMTVAQSAQLIVQGVREANDALEADESDGNGDRRWPRVGHLSLIELYLDRASEAWRGLKMAAEADAAGYVLDDTIQSAQGALPRPLDSSYRGADYDFIRAATQNGPDGESVAYTLDTKRARSETRAQPMQEALIKSLIGQAADDRSQDLQIRRTLFRLLVPTDLEPFLTGTTEAQFEVDSGTAGIPWELLDDVDSGNSDKAPWAIRTKLLRKLRTAEFRAQVADADADAHVLIIGEPECDPKIYPPLVGAQQEAQAVRDALVAAGGLRDEQVVALTSLGDGQPSGPNARTVINALMQRDWRIVHIAAHGEPPELVGPVPAKRGDPPQQIGDPRGVVLSNTVYLGSREINSMRTIPELVFVNCCYLAARDLRQLFTKEQQECEPRYRNDRPTFASGVAEALIKVGVRCVIAAGWAVDDGPAMVFARTFYERLLKGHRFIDAVAFARDAAWRLGGNTWAAYQCYGDPDWIFRRGVSDAQRPASRASDPYASIASARDLVLALQTIAVKCESPRASKPVERERIGGLERRFKDRWGHCGRVAESFAIAYAKAGDERTAVEWYTKALRANDGGASVKAAEQRANLQVRLAWNSVHDVFKEREAASGKKGAEIDNRLRKVIAQAKPDITSAITVLEKLIAIEPSMERASLLGSAYKRLALIAEGEGDAASEATAISAMKGYYEEAERIGRDNKLEGFFYPALNRLSAEFASGVGPVPLDPQAVAVIRADLDSMARDKPDFWNVVSQIELRLYESLSRGDLAIEVSKIIAAYDDLHLRIQLEWMWSSVYDQAQFVLPKYAKNAPATEQEATKRVMDRLGELSGRSNRESARTDAAESRSVTTGSRPVTSSSRIVRPRKTSSGRPRPRP